MSDLKQRILSMASKELESIEVSLKDNLNPFLDIISNVASHIMFSGGKRFRPLVMVISAKLCGYTGEFDKTISTIFEYLHTASLMHDDLIDEATLRRGKPVAQVVWNNATAILFGDFLLARTLSIALKSDYPELLEIIAEITESMTQGEIYQLVNKGKIDLTEKEYMTTIEKKTAILIKGACQTGAIIARASEEQTEALIKYGYNLGMAFQMADDLLDYLSETDSLGKKIGVDLKEGKLTLPVIYSLEKARKDTHNEDIQVMESIIKNPEFTDSDFEKFRKLLVKYGGIKYTEEKAKGHIYNAKDALSIFKDSKEKDLLSDLADYTLSRKI